MPCLEITTTIGCPLKCTFCPQDRLHATYGAGRRYMTSAVFSTILSNVPDHVRIDFSGLSEPWASKDCTTMLSRALGHGYHVGIYTTLVGMTDPETVIDLLLMYRDQVEIVCLHLPDVHGNMPGFVYTEEYEKCLVSFIELGESKSLRKFEMMTMSGSGEVDLSIRHLVGVSGWVGNNRAGNLEKNPLLEVTPHHDEPVGCSFTPFYDHNVVLPNGDVVLCCMDYSSKHKLGNLLNQDYYSLFASEELARLRSENMKIGHSRSSLCKTCSRAQRYVLQEGHKQFWEPLDHLVTTAVENEESESE